MIKIWGKILRNNKIIKNHMIEINDDFSENSVFDGVYEICIKFDIPRPIVLNKHIKDMNKFLIMRFFPDDFIEKVDFDKFDIEIFVEKKNN